MSSGALSGIWKERRLLGPAFAAAIGVGYLPLLVVPWTIGALVSETGRSDSWAGWIATAEITALALSSLAFTGYATRPGRRWLAAGGALLAIAANGVAFMAAPDGLVFLAARILSGAGCGIAAAVGNAAAGGSRNPTRAFASLWFGMAVWQIVIFNFTPWIIAHAGVKGAFGLIAGSAALYLPLLLCMPDPSPQVSGEKPTAPLSSPRLLVTLIVAAFTWFWLRDALVYSMSERITVALGLNGQQLGNLLGVSSILGLAGPTLAAKFGGESPSASLLAGGLLLGLIISGLMAFGISPLVFCLATILMPGVGLFGASLLSGLAGYVDRTGRLAALGAGAGFVSEAVGPALGGSLLHVGGLSALAIATLITATLALISAVAAVRLARGHVAGLLNPDRPKVTPS